MRRLANASSSDATIFGRSVAKFVVCTEESREKDPAVVVRNVRQFISGMKNYLIRNGEGDLHAVIEDERKKVSYSTIASSLFVTSSRYAIIKKEHSISSNELKGPKQMCSYLYVVLLYTSHTALMTSEKLRDTKDVWDGCRTLNV